VGTIGRVQTVFTGWDGAPGLQTSFYHLDTTWQWAGYHQNVTDGVEAAYTAAAGLFPDGMTFTVNPIIDIFEDTTGEMLESFEGTSDPVSGMGGADWGPTATGLCVTWRTGGIVNNKRVRGRSFLVPVAATKIQSDGTPTMQALTEAGQWASTMEGGLSPYGDLVVWHRPINDLGGSSHIVTSHTITDQFAVLRSRRD